MKNLDIERLTLGEVSTIEGLTGMSIAEIGDTDKPVGKTLAALAMVAKRRNGEPKFTFNDALALTIDEAHEILGIDVEDVPVEDVPDDDAAEVKAPKAKAKATN